MRLVTGIIGCFLLTLAVLHAFIPRESYQIFMWLYGAGALCAFISMKGEMPLLLVRVLALVTTGAMFFYFAVFFKMAPHFQEEWYRSAAALEALGMLLSAFAMIPVLSCYSCMLKADCRETLQQANSTRRAFFSVPEGVKDN